MVARRLLAVLAALLLAFGMAGCGGTDATQEDSSGGDPVEESGDGVDHMNGDDEHDHDEGGGHDHVDDDEE